MIMYSLETWYQENPGTREKFTLVFPVTVVIDGEEVIMDQDAFEELTASQRNDRSDTEKIRGTELLNCNYKCLIRLKCQTVR